MRLLLAAAAVAVQPYAVYAYVTAPVLPAARSHHIRQRAPGACAALVPAPLVEPRKAVTIKGQTLTPPGVFMSLSVFAIAAIVQVPCFLAYLWSRLFDAKRRSRGVDWIIHFWAWASMTLSGYRPEIVGLENLEGLDSVLYVPNHTSFLDILTLSGFIPRPIKYVSKKDILKIPFIGWPMRFAGHIPLQTESRRSQLDTFKRTVKSLEDGNSVITFPEGGRSSDGRMMAFKRGPFKIAMQAGRPIVPVSICGLAQWYPKGSLVPLDIPKGVRVVIHPPIDVTATELSEGELCDHVYDIVNSALPDYQQRPRNSSPP